MRFIRSHAILSMDLDGHSAPVTSVAWSPGGAELATGGYDGCVVIWSCDSWTPKNRFQHSRLVNGVRWSPDGRLLAVACADGHCLIWNPATEELVAVLSRHTDDVNSVAWSPSGDYLLTASEDGTTRIWETRSSQLEPGALFHEH